MSACNQSMFACQKAPSAKRCIKTGRCWSAISHSMLRVRKHQAPRGALRQGSTRTPEESYIMCQKAPSTKRCIKTPRLPALRTLFASGQKAPSAKRCIKTCHRKLPNPFRAVPRQKAPSAKRCIKTCEKDLHGFSFAWCQKAPSAKRCIKTVVVFFTGKVPFLSESTEPQKVH